MLRIEALCLMREPCEAMNRTHLGWNYTPLWLRLFGFPRYRVKGWPHAPDQHQRPWRYSNTPEKYAIAFSSEEDGE